MILSFFTQKSTRSAKLSSVFAERFSGEGQADFAINKAHKVEITCISVAFLMVLSIVNEKMVAIHLLTCRQKMFLYKTCVIAICNILWKTFIICFKHPL